MSLSVDRLRADALIFADEGTGISQCSIGRNIALALTTTAGECRTIRGSELTDVVIHDVVTVTRLSPARAATPETPPSRSTTRTGDAFPHAEYPFRTEIFPRVVEDPAPTPAVVLHPAASRPGITPHLVAVPTFSERPTSRSGNHAADDLDAADEADDATVMKITSVGPNDATVIREIAAPPATEPEPEPRVVAGAPAHLLADAPTEPDSGDGDDIEDDVDDATVMRAPADLRPAADIDDSTVMRAPTDLHTGSSLDDATIISTSAERAALSALARAAAEAPPVPPPPAVPAHAEDAYSQSYPGAYGQGYSLSYGQAPQSYGQAPQGNHLADAPPFPSAPLTQTSTPPAPPSTTYRVGPSEEPTIHLDAAPSPIPAVTVEDVQGPRIYLVDDSLYVGRAPANPGGTPAHPRSLAAVISPTESVSSTHLRLRRQGQQILVWDMWSTNGTTVNPPAAAPYRLGSGEELAIVPGTWLDLGDGVRVSVGGPSVP